CQRTKHQPVFRTSGNGDKILRSKRAAPKIHSYFCPSTWKIRCGGAETISRRLGHTIFSNMWQSYIFAEEATIHDVIHSREQQTRMVLVAIPSDQLRVRSVDDLVSEFVERFRL